MRVLVLQGYVIIIRYRLSVLVSDPISGVSEDKVYVDR
jgi:hypothetical protein